MLKKRDFVYDEHYDCYPCPQGQVLENSTTNREGKTNTNPIPRSARVARSFADAKELQIIKKIDI
ncbi:hypothetical protein [Pelagicoccus mobilis]|uniref:hypothetical protein n=1 Tax=Pelagicoccus mobilis TaxID=415221 RepID=UPI001F40AC30|nr:hypothetical protein [Pelagicoccus mobilis]